MGAAIGGAFGALSWINNPTCFTAGTQVVVGVTIERDDGDLLEVRTPEMLERLYVEGAGEDRGGEVAVASRVKIVGYITESIERLRAGDCVLARDENDAKGRVVLRRVEEVFERTAYKLTVLTIRDSKGVEQTIHTTAEHPAYVLGKGWVAAGELRPGDALSEPTGGGSTIRQVDRENHFTGIAVYNMRVNNCHTYFVRKNSIAEPIWVHNSGRGGCGGIESYEAMMEDMQSANASRVSGVRSANGTGLLEQPRDAFGRFLPKNGGEISPGSLAEAAVWDAVEAKPGWTVVRGRIYATDGAGQIRVYDGYARSPAGRVIGLEVKSNTSRLTGDQRAFDGWLNSSYQNKAVGIGEHAGLQIDRALEIRWP